MILLLGLYILILLERAHIKLICRFISIILFPASQNFAEILLYFKKFNAAGGKFAEKMRIELYVNTLKYLIQERYVGCFLPIFILPSVLSH